MENLVNTVNPLAIDFVIAIVILLVACIKARAGIYHSVMSIVVIVLALALGFVGVQWFKAPVCEFAWQEIGPRVEKEFDDRVDAAMKGEESLGQMLRGVWNDIIGSTEIDKLTALEIHDEDFDPQNSESIQKAKLITLMKAKLLCDKICQVILFGVLSGLAFLALTIIKNIVGEIADFSIIGWANHLLGFLFGALEVIVILLVIVRGAGVLGIHFFQDMSQDTVILKWLVNGDLDTALYAVRHLTVQDIQNIDIKDLTTVDFESVGKQVEELIENIDLTEATDKIDSLVDSVNQMTQP